MEAVSSIFNNYCQPEDIVDRIVRTKTYDFPHRPNIILAGNNGEFGTLYIDLHYRTLQWRIYIRDREKILNAARLAIDNFEKYGFAID